MNKAKMIELVRDETSSTVAGARSAVDTLFNSIAKSLKKEGSITIAGFGTFRVTKRKARKGRNPQTGAEIKIAASKSVRFKPSKTLRATI
jgi:DNA-binding protein HU-beta